MKTVYRIDAWCTCKDQATLDSITGSLLSQLKTQKTNGNVMEGDVTKRTIETPEEITVHNGV